VDGMISFPIQIAAVLKPTDCLLDDDNSYRRG
jgi:hypothetical protein